ncbi:MAG: metal ABC transporter substrate-binding protein [Candidatus Eremiobacteraeota bacterium]|nr:metal ABC transporter substrate-binding protein [Candidatus Eremiobacteraeota bacterium]
MPSPRSAVAALALLLLVACSHAAADRPAGPLRIVATTTTLASIARGAAGTQADVRSLVPVGTSPEDFQPSPDVIAALRNADVLVENGAGLESWLDATIRNAGNPRLRVVVCADGLPVRDGNPHLWMDPELARVYATKIRAALITADAPNAAGYRATAAAYDKELAALTARTRAKIATIPVPRRTMIVFHNAFDYYARRFGLRIVGAIEPTAGAEPNPAHVSELVRLARAEHVPAVFAEHEYSDKLARTLAASAGGLTVAFLYDDSLGTDAAVSTYTGIIDADTDAIVSALK